MTAREVVEAFRDASRVPINEDVLVAWINEIEGHIYYDIVLNHEGGDLVYYHDKSLAFGYDDQLLAPGPYAKLYTDYLSLKRDISYGDFKRYQISSEMFSISFGDFGDWYNRTHRPLRKARSLRTHGGIG